jgi:hypothetical protein
MKGWKMKIAVIPFSIYEVILVNENDDVIFAAYSTIKVGDNIKNHGYNKISLEKYFETKNNKKKEVVEKIRKFLAKNEMYEYLI